MVEDLNIMMQISQDVDHLSAHFNGDTNFIADAPFIVHMYREETFKR